MDHPIITKIVEQGVQSVNVSMISADLRKKLLTEAGNILMHKGKHKEAAEAYYVGGNIELLQEQGKWFLEQRKPGVAAYFLLHIEKQEFLHDLAQQCVETHNLESARAVYEKLGDKVMVEFLEQNFEELQKKE
jgi:methylmalonyl-CoA mutase cobalamin-binding subunit